MRILLVAPSQEYPVVSQGWDARPGWLGIPQMSLLILQALSGDEHEVVTVEEEQGARTACRTMGSRRDYRYDRHGSPGV